MKYKVPDIVPQTFSGLRGFACLCVILFHLTDPPTLYNYPFLNCISFLRAPPFIQLGLRWVDLFFILSGFVLTLRYIKSTHGDYLKNRIFRIFPLHLMIIGLFFITNLTAHYVDTKRFSYQTLPFNIFLIQSWFYDMRTTWNYPAWTLSSEWFLYLFLTLFILLKKKNWLSEKKMIWIFTLLLASTVGPGQWAFGILNPSLLRTDLRDFVLGVLLALVCDSKKIKRISGRIEFFFLSMIIVYAFFYFEKTEYISYGFGLLILAIFSNRERLKRNRISHVLGQVGMMSFSLYMWHIFLLEKMAPSIYDWVPIWAVSTYFSILFLVSYVSYLTIENWLYNRLKKISSSESLG